MASQACLASPVSSWPGLSEAWAADREKGARAAVKTKMDKRFILSYSVKLGWEVRGGFQGPSERIFRRPRVGLDYCNWGREQPSGIRILHSVAPPALQFCKAACSAVP